MSRTKQFIRRVLRLPGVPEARHVAERAVAPYLRADLSSMHETLLAHNHRLVYVENRVNTAADAVEDVQRHMPAVLNAIASTNGTARLLKRDLDATRDDLDATRDELDEVRTMMEQWDRLQVESGDRLAAVEAGVQSVVHVARGELAPHIETIAWLLTRVETVRAEVLHELRYGRDRQESDPPVEIVNPAGLESDDLRLNLGCGHVLMDGYVNTDIRALPGVDVVAPANALPLEPRSVTEIFSAHMLEHFPELELRRKLLPYWFSLLREGGSFRAVVPDLDAMMQQYVTGEISFDELRLVAYGGQEYDGDFHFTAFTPESLTELLVESGFEDVTLVERGRRNGDCLEFEIAARRPV